jgi:hypothetical protein
METIEKSIQDQRVLLDAIHATLVTTQELGSKVITTRETQALSRLPKITIFLDTEADVERVQAFADIDGGMLSILERHDYPFNEIATCIPRIGPIGRQTRNALELHTLNLAAHRALLDPRNSDDLASHLRLSSRSFAKPEIYWVCIQSTKMTHQLRRDHSGNLAHWARQTRLSIKHVDFKCNKLLWGFDTIAAAEQACKYYIRFSGAIGWAM